MIPQPASAAAAAADVLPTRCAVIFHANARALRVTSGAEVRVQVETADTVVSMSQVREPGTIFTPEVPTESHRPTTERWIPVIPLQVTVM